MKVIHIPRRFVREEWGGTETMVLQLCRAMLSKGHQAIIHTSLALGVKRTETILDVPVRRHSYSYPFWGLSADAKHTLDKKGGNMLSLSLLWALLREKKVDVFHAHTGKRIGAVVRTVARLRGKPYVITLHGGYYDVPAGEAEKILDPLANTIEWGKVFGALLGARRVLEDADAVLCVGENELQAARKALPGKRVELMPNGVDTAFFAEGDGKAFRHFQGIPPDRKLILCVSRIDYQKNQLALVEAMPEILKKEPDAHLLMIGPVTIQAYREKIDQAIFSLELGQHVTLLPGIPFADRQLADAFHAADVFCLPSLHEPFGIVILEAWASGLPVVAANVGGIPSFTNDGENLLLFNPEQPAQIAAAINRVFDDKSLAEKLSVNGKNRARERYDWSVISEQLMALYTELIEQKH
jgi:glycosyltransferase involved in cell wall biosynthesis